jgi:hypothetical protein
MASESNMKPTRVTYAIDIGSTRNGKFAWLRLESPPRAPCESGTSIDKCVEAVVRDLRDELPVALGTECPAFIPIPENSANLSRGRKGERDRSCFAPAGGYVTVLGLHQLAWILREVKGKLGSVPSFTLEPGAWSMLKTGGSRLLLWEAFVSGEAHSETDLADAETAAVEFEMRLRDALAKTTNIASDVTLEDGR